MQYIDQHNVISYVLLNVLPSNLLNVLLNVLPSILLNVLLDILLSTT